MAPLSAYLVVKSTPFGVYNHLPTLRNNIARLGESGHVVHVRCVGPRPENAP